jgi:hypothetical protein
VAAELGRRLGEVVAHFDWASNRIALGLETSETECRLVFVADIRTRDPVVAAPSEQLNADR